MLGPSWKLLFGSVLLLGQLTCGVEGCCPGPPEDRCCERPKCCPEARCCERPREEGCCTEETSVSEEWDEPDLWEYDSDEHAEFLSMLQRRQMEKAAAYETVVIPEYFKQMAVSHYNDHNSGPYYRHLEDAHLKVKKAIGTMAYLHLFLEKTSCIRDKQRDRHVTYTNEYLDALACGSPPEFEREKLDCTFGIFMDARSGHQAVVSHNCVHLQNPEGSLEYLK